MTSPQQIFNDPKREYITSIIRQTDKISVYLGVLKFTDAALELGILLDRVNIPQSREDLKKLQENFNEDNYVERTRKEIRTCYRVVCNYLNSTYFKGYDAAIGEADFQELENEGEGK